MNNDTQTMNNDTQTKAYTPHDAKVLLLAGMGHEGMTVDGYLNLRGTNITSLPANLTVCGYLDLAYTKLTSLPANLTVCGGLDLACTNITSLPANLTVDGDLYLASTNITSLPANLTVSGYLDLAYTKLTSLPADILAETPTIEALDGKIYNAIKAGGELDMSNWHTCETTHCRAGWAVHLAGKKGKQLEEKWGAGAAGAFIYFKNTGRIPDFYCADDDEAMEDIKRCAGVEVDDAVKEQGGGA